jgi:Trp operon repressor
MKNKFILPLKQIANKNKVQNCILFFLSLFLIISCERNNESKIKQSIENLEEKYPQLITGKKPPENEFKFIKSVRDGKFNLEIQLFSQEEGYENRNHILVFINGKNEIYSIPLFNNKYKDYWEFPFDKQLPNIPKTNTTFSNELNIGIDKLINNNDRRKSLKRYTLIDEMLNSVLNCKNVKEKDSVIIYKIMRGTIDIPDENQDTVRKRLRKNYDLMKLEWQSEGDFDTNCYFDEKNNRIYQIEYIKNKIKFKTYRMDYGMHYIYL